MSAPNPKKPFSMIREFHLADWFTLGNAICGTAAIFSTITYVQTGAVRHVYFACALVLAALLFDIVDGRVARWRERSSVMGEGTGFTRGCHFLRRRSRDDRLRLRHARFIRSHHPGLLRRLWGVAPGSIQCHGRVPVRRRRQSDLFRRHANSNLISPGLFHGDCDVARCRSASSCGLANSSSPDTYCIP